MVGYGAESERLTRLKRQRGLDNVLMVGQVPREEAKLYLIAADVTVVLLRKSGLFRTVIPSKLFEGMAARRPVVLGVDGEARRILEEAQAGIAIEPENAGQLAEAVLKLRADPDVRRHLGENGRRAVKQRFDRKALAKKMLATLWRVAARASRARSPSRLTRTTADSRPGYTI